MKSNPLLTTGWLSFWAALEWAQLWVQRAPHRPPDTSPARCFAGSSGLCRRGQGESRKAAQVRQDQPHPRPQPGVPGESGAWGMMTAKEYVEGKVKSYTRLAERCRLEAEASDDIVVRAGYSARANVWEMCAEEMDNVREMLQEESGEITYA